MSFVFTYLLKFSDRDTFCVPTLTVKIQQKSPNINNKDKNVTKHFDSFFLSNYLSE